MFNMVNVLFVLCSIEYIHLGVQISPTIFTSDFNEKSYVIESVIVYSQNGSFAFV